MKKNRILFTIPNFLTAGSGREMFNIIERLDKHLFEPFIAVQQAGGELYNEIIAKGYPVLIGPFHIDEHVPFPNKLVSAFFLAKKFRSYNFGIWQSFNWSSDYSEALVAKFCGARYVYVKKNMNWGRLAWKVKSHLSSAIVARNSSLVNGPFAVPRLRYKTFFVPGGVTSQSAIASTSDVRKRLNIPASVILISCVAQIVKAKDQATLIKAVSRIENVYLVLAGAERDNEYAESLRSLIAENRLNERVLLIGSIGNVNEVLRASNIFVLPTTDKGGHEEGCPVALLEAMAAGVPCIVSDVAGSRDLVKEQQTGLLFAPGNDEELAERIIHYVNNPIEALTHAGNAQRMVEADYTLEKEAAGFSNVYLQMLNR